MPSFFFRFVRGGIFESGTYTNRQFVELCMPRDPVEFGPLSHSVCRVKMIAYSHLARQNADSSRGVRRRSANAKLGYLSYSGGKNMQLTMLAG